MLRLWINFSRGGSKNIWVSVSDGVLYFGTGEWRSRNRSSFFPGKRNMTWIYAPTSFFKKLYQSFFLFFFFCSHTLDNLIFKLAKIEMRCVHICERLWDTNTLQTFSVLNIRSPAAAVARSHFSFFRQVPLWSYQGKVLIPKAFCAGFHYESPIFRKRSLWKENTPPPPPLSFFFFFFFICNSVKSSDDTSLWERESLAQQTIASENVEHLIPKDIPESSGEQSRAPGIITQE